MGVGNKDMLRKVVYKPVLFPTNTLPSHTGSLDGAELPIELKRSCI